MNIIFYVLDSLRVDHLSCYGYERGTSPNIDNLCKDGIVFTNAFAQSTWTKPSAASMLTSMYPSVHKVEYMDSFFNYNLFRLPDFLKLVGYKTYAVSSMGQVSTPMGFNKSFDVFIDLYKESTTNARYKIKDKKLENIIGDKEISLPRSEDINNHLFPFFSEQSKDNFFFIWSIDTHVPFCPPEEFSKFLDPLYSGKIDGTENSIKNIQTELDKKRIIDLYDSEIYYNDFHIGKLIEELKNKKIYDDSLIIITGDHGESFRFEDGNIGHGHIPFDDLVRVPLIIKFPKSQYGGQVISEIIQHIDIMPTILNFLGIDYKDYEFIQGKNILDITKNKSQINLVTYSETRQYRLKDTYYSVRSCNMKYILKENESSFFSNIKELDLNVIIKILRNPIYFFKRKYSVEKEMLFDLERDSFEKVNRFLNYDNPEKIDEFKKLLNIYISNNEMLANKLQEMNEDALMQKVNIDKYMKNQLKILGYL
ncbi:MAG: sulfatase [Candidatus Methanofastidiosum sp.]|nr:sulfatase [Methanofastidiosum sp.]